MAGQEKEPLADRVLPLIRTRRDLHRWRDANDHGRQMHVAVDILEQAAVHGDPDEVFGVTHKAIASAMRVIARADDSSGIIGDACRRLLALHPVAATGARASATRLVDWMITFQFHGEVDYFALDPVAYGPALGDLGMARYRRRLEEIASSLGPRPAPGESWSSPQSREWFVVEWNEQRLAVHDRDIDAIVRTHARDRRVAAWLQDTAEAFEEIGEIDLALDWARQASEFDSGHQAKQATEYRAGLLARHRPEGLLPLRLESFDRWPSSGTAAQLHAATAAAWPQYENHVLARLARSPRDAVLFVLLTLGDAPRAWRLAHELSLTDKDTWQRLADAYERLDPLAVLPVLADLTRDDLTVADATMYRTAATRLARMRRIAAGSDHAPRIDALIAELREQNRQRPRLQAEFDKAGLPRS